MRILLFVSGINNTFEEANKETFQEIIKKLEDIADIEQDQVIIISFCDTTQNIRLIFNYYRYAIEYSEFRKIHFGRQMLGDLYYNRFPNGGACVYEEPFNKENEVFKYARELEKNDNFINLYYIDSNLDEDKLNDLFKNENDIDINLIKDAKNPDEIIQSLDKCIREKKLLEY